MSERSLGKVSGQIGIEVTGAQASLEQLLDSVNKTISNFKNLDTAIKNSGNNLNNITAGGSNAFSKAAQDWSNQVLGIKKSNDDLADNTKKNTDRVIFDLNNMATTAQTIASKLAGISIGFGLALKEGLQTTVTLATIERRFTAITGSQEKAKVLMQQITDEAHKFGQSSLDAQQSLIALVPNLKNGVKDLAQYTGLALRLASIKPAQGIQGATYAINEALSSGNFRSLVERFEIGRTAIKDALKQSGGDWAQALDIVLNKMGATEKAAMDAGHQWNASADLLKESFERALSAGLQPFLDILSKVLKGTADFIDGIRETNPQLLTIVTGFMAATVAAGGLALVIGQVSKALSLVQAQVSEGFLSKIGGLLAVGGGIELGKFAYSKLSGEKPEEVNDKFNKIVTVGMDFIVKAFIGTATTLIKIFYDAGLTIQKIINNISGQGYKTNEEVRIDKIKSEFNPDEMRKSFKEFYSKMSLDQLNGGLKQSGSDKFNFTNKEEAINYAVNRAINNMMDANSKLINADDTFKNGLDKAATDMEKSFLETIGAISKQTPQAITNGDSGTTSPVTSQFNDEQLNAWQDYSDRLAEINKNFQDESLKEDESYTRERKQKVDDFNESQKREMSDEITRRKRAEDKLNEDIADKIRDGEDKRADIIKDRQDKISDIISKASDEEEKKKQDHQDKLAKIDRDANRSIIDAARNLDAEGVRKAVERRNDAIKEENDQYSKGETELKDKREQQVQEEIKTSEAKLDENKKSNQKAIDELKRHYETEEAQRKQDFERKRERELIDFNGELTLYDQAHIRKLNDLKTQAESERAQAQDKFIRAYDAAEQNENRKLQMTRNFYALQEQALSQFIANMQAKTSTASQQQYNVGITNGGKYDQYPTYTYTPKNPTPGQPIIKRFAPGSPYVTGDGLAYLEKGEGIVPSGANQAIRNMLGKQYTGAQLVNALNKKSSSGGLSIQHFNPVLEFGDIGSYSKQEIYEIASDALMDKLQQVSNELNG